MLGPIILSARTIVGANAVLLKSTDPDAMYVGIPAKKIKAASL